jgi:ribosome maturation factor RimP
MRAQSELELRILDMVEPVASGLGLDIVRVRVTGSQTPTLQIMAERPDGTMTVAACAKLSRALNPILEAEDPIAGEYSLEVSSPGIDRPLTRKGDFARWLGHEVKIELSYPNAEGRKRFHGWIEGETDGVVALRLKDGGETTIAVDDMSRALLVLTDKLIQDARAKGQAAADVAVDEDEEDFDGEADGMSGETGEDFDEVEVGDDEEFDEDEDLDAEDEDERK